MNHPDGRAHRRRILAPVLLLALALVASLITPAHAQGARTAVELLQLRVGQIREGVPLAIGGETIASTVVLPDFYERRGFQPAWPDAKSRAELLATLRGCEADGLDPADYHVAEIEALSRAPGTPEANADLDLLATDGVIRLAYHLRFGKVDRVTLQPDWEFKPSEEAELREDPVEALERAVEKHAVAAGLDSLRPSHWLYASLRRALAHYRALESAGGWKSLAGGPALRPGAADPRLDALEARLAIEGDLATAPRTGVATYDTLLVAGVERFQERHGLTPDGIVGAATIRAFNVSATARVQQLRISLERGRLLLHDLPERLVVVNIPAFRALYVDAGRVQLSSRVVVGKPYTQTPIFRADMTYVVLNPSWTIPPGIMKSDVIPGLKRDPNYLEKKGFVRVGNQIVQPPGPDNALGRIKLMFPNPHFVYLHDTPHRELFAENARAFSAGCIRVEKIVDLTVRVIGDSSRWSRAKLEAAIATGQTRNITLPRRLPVLVTYWTAVADRSDGKPYFYADAYGRDPAFIAALDRPFRDAKPEARVKW